jgi:hypothetical protein
MTGEQHIAGHSWIIYAIVGASLLAGAAAVLIRAIGYILGGNYIQ